MSDDQSPKALPGPKGEKGDTGPKGDKGAKGDMGKDGDTGPEGQPGNNCDASEIRHYLQMNLAFILGAGNRAYETLTSATHGAASICNGRARVTWTVYGDGGDQLICSICSIGNDAQEDEDIGERDNEEILQYILQMLARRAVILLLGVDVDVDLNEVSKQYTKLSSNLGKNHIIVPFKGATKDQIQIPDDGIKVTIPEMGIFYAGKAFPTAKQYADVIGINSDQVPQDFEAVDQQGHLFVHQKSTFRRRGHTWAKHLMTDQEWGAHKALYATLTSSSEKQTVEQIQIKNRFKFTKKELARTVLVKAAANAVADTAKTVSGSVQSVASRFSRWMMKPSERSERQAEAVQGGGDSDEQYYSLAVGLILDQSSNMPTYQLYIGSNKKKKGGIMDSKTRHKVCRQKQKIQAPEGAQSCSICDDTVRLTAVGQASDTVAQFKTAVNSGVTDLDSKKPLGEEDFEKTDAPIQTYMWKQCNLKPLIAASKRASADNAAAAEKAAAEAAAEAAEKAAAEAKQKTAAEATADAADAADAEKAAAEAKQKAADQTAEQAAQTGAQEGSEAAVATATAAQQQAAATAQEASEAAAQKAATAREAHDAAKAAAQQEQEKLNSFRTELYKFNSGLHNSLLAYLVDHQGIDRGKWDKDVAAAKTTAKAKPESATPAVAEELPTTLAVAEELPTTLAVEEATVTNPMFSGGGLRAMKRQILAAEARQGVRNLAARRAFNALVG